MMASFVELPAFERHRETYLDDESLAQLQIDLMSDPAAGDLIQGAGGARKLRFADRRRGKGKRGGLRVIYYHWAEGAEFWLFAVYDKGEMVDLTPRQRQKMREMIKAEVKARSEHEQETGPIC